MSDHIILSGIEGIARKTGTDQHGCQWIEFETDFGALEEPGECAICGRTIRSGWLCLDGGDEVCDEHVAIEEPPAYGDFDHIRTWRDGHGHNYRLELYDTNRLDRWGKCVLAYQFFHQGRLIFEGADFGCSPMHAIDSDATVAGVLTFFSLRPGDTDPDYFEDYTPEQIAFAQQEGENLSLLVEGLEER